MTAGDDNTLRVERLCEQTLALVGARAEAEVGAFLSVEALTRFANSSIHQNVTEESARVFLRLAVGGRVAAASTNRADGEGLAWLVESTLEAARLQAVDPDWPGLAPAAATLGESHYDSDTHHSSPERRAELVRAFVDEGPGLRAAGYCETTGAFGAFANTAGQRAASRTSSAILDGIHQTATSAGGGHQSSARVGDLDGRAAGADAARKATTGEEPGNIEAGDYEVILGPSCVAQVLLFLAYYGFNARAAAEGQSFVHLGERQFDEQVGVWDDVTGPGAVGLAYDGEGTPRRRLALIDQGTTAALLHNRRTAAKAGTESTGHATFGSSSFGPVPAHLVMNVGTTPVEAMVRSMDRGLLVSDFNYIRILDPKTQVCTGLTRNGTFLVEGGEVVGPVRDLRFTQSFVAGLAPGRLLAVGDDRRLVAAQLAPPMQVPSLHLSSWHFTGGAKG